MVRMEGWEDITLGGEVGLGAPTSTVAPAKALAQQVASGYTCPMEGFTDLWH